MRKYLADPEEALAYLNVVLEDGHPGLIAHALNLIQELHSTGKHTAIKENFAKQIKMSLRSNRPTPRASIRRVAPKPLRAAPKRTRKVAA
jgi:hypothetical protein